jgi:hypothetical protein
MEPDLCEDAHYAPIQWSDWHLLHDLKPVGEPEEPSNHMGEPTVIPSSASPQPSSRSIERDSRKQHEIVVEQFDPRKLGRRLQDTERPGDQQRRILHAREVETSALPCARQEHGMSSMEQLRKKTARRQLVGQGGIHRDAPSGMQLP